MHDIEKPLIWIGSSYKDLLTLPNEVKRGFGYALFGSIGTSSLVDQNFAGVWRVECGGDY
jgi:phage-related protein